MAVETNNVKKKNYLETDPGWDTGMPVDLVCKDGQGGAQDFGVVIKPVGDHKLLIRTNSGKITTRPERLVRASQ